MKAWLAIVIALAGLSTTNQEAEKAVLADLPSPPGPHVTKIRALKAGEWLMLGTPAPDPRWGPAPGRAYTNKMAYAPDLVGAFLVGEGSLYSNDGDTPRKSAASWMRSSPSLTKLCPASRSKVRAEKTLEDCLDAIDAFKAITGLNPITLATPDDCERFQVEALLKPKNWKQRYPKSKKDVETPEPQHSPEMVA